MREEVYIFFYENMSIGGCQLLILKLARQMSENGKTSMIICHHIDEHLKHEFEEKKIDILCLKEWDNDKYLKQTIRKYSINKKVITFFWNDFLRLKCLCVNEKILFYAVHYDAVNNVCFYKYKFIEKIKKLLFSSLIKKYLEMNSIIIMDELTLNKTKEYYNFSISETKKWKVIRIPIDIHEQELKTSIREKNGILTIARADFPFKGYLFGLVELMNSEELFKDIKLDIISYGNGFEKLKEKIEECNKEVKNRILLHGKTNYKDLSTYFQKCRVYVGMGTTLLDATINGAISIPVQAYTYKVISNGLFSDNYCDLGVIKGTEEDFFCSIEKILKMDDKSYRLQAQKDKEQVKKYYSTESVCRQIIQAMDEMNMLKPEFRVILYYYLRKIIIGLKKKIERPY